MLGRSRAVVAFEPRPDQARELATMFDAVGAAVRVEAVALSERTGSSTMRVLAADPGRSTIEDANALADEDGSLVETIDVPSSRLDDYALDNVGFVKIDVEGHELAVLRGATATIERNRPRFLIEAEERHRGNAVAEVVSFLGRLGYDGYFLLGREQRPIDEFVAEEHQNARNIASWKDGWIRTGSRYVNNFVFLPSS
jgi:FkbM family methyltransferase